ncbi:hypothetical protein V6N12_057377 [Hibiscus sabdariffa]|uniref:Uncharacterized protein n=1 Tax=Hibiscus sabdariffa TaxID=183260 RepID=A0ABR2DBN6_9ROSI
MGVSPVVGGSPAKEQQAAGVGILLQIMMLVLSFVLGHVLRRHTFYYLPEASASLLIGLIVGGLANISDTETSIRKIINSTVYAREMLMDIRAGFGSLKSQSFWKTPQKSCISSSNHPCSYFKTFCSKKDSQQQPQQNDNNNESRALQALLRGCIRYIRSSYFYFSGSWKRKIINSTVYAREMLMDIRAGFGSLKSQSFWKTPQKSCISSSNHPCSYFKTFCSKKDSQQQPQQNGDNNVVAEPGILGVGEKIINSTVYAREMLMDIRAGFGSLKSQSFWKTPQKSCISSSNHPCSYFKTFCSKKDSQQQPKQNDDNKVVAEPGILGVGEKIINSTVYAREMLMDIRAGFGSLKSQSFWKTPQKSCISSSNHPCSYFKTFCSKKDSQQQPQQNDDNNGDKFSTDWDKAWSSFRKQSKKSFFSGFSPNKYVTWNPRQSNYPLSEEVDPIKRAERSNLMLWTSPGFTLVGAIIIVSFLLLYTILAPVK